MKTTERLFGILTAIARTLAIATALLLAINLSGCAKPPIIITGPMGIVANDDSYKVVRITNNGSAYWRFWITPEQQIILYPGQSIFMKHASDFWRKNFGFWAHAYLEVDRTGRVKSSTFAGEQQIYINLTGRKWVCNTGQAIGADITLGDAPGAYYPFPTKFSSNVPLLPIVIHGSIR